MGKYSNYWKTILPSIKEKMKKSDSYGFSKIQLSQRKFEQLGDRKRYSFNLQFNGVEVTNNIGGSAVARDLAKVMKDDSETRKLLMNARYNIKMDQSFVLKIYLENTE